MRLARVYDAPQPDDGVRVLVDRLWPRGLRRDDARIDRWCKAVAPSSPLRKWYNHDPGRYDEFVARYEQELGSPDALAGLDELKTLLGAGPVTLLTSARDVAHGHLPVLARLIEKR